MEIHSLYELYKEHFLVDTDTRNIRKNTIFFALKGANFNGNTFAEKALALGANYAIVDEKEYQTNSRIILVDDVLQTLQKLANYHRNQLEIPFIGLTGSNGKTTTKELIYAVLNKKYNAIATKGNLNNHIGVPLTLLSIQPEHDIAIIEMGANHQKEIEFLCSICEPDYGYITNFGKAHLEGFGGVEGVIKGKSELYNYLKENHKTAIVNPDDKIQVEKTETIQRVFFDKDKIQLKASNPFLSINYHSNMIQTQIIGTYNFNNITAAITFGELFNVPKKGIINALETYVSENNRSQIIEKKNTKIILDAYNANPSSMKVALENFSDLKGDDQLIILGDMFELGDESEKEHQAIADLASSLQIQNQYFIGEHFYKVTTAHKKFRTFDDFKSYIDKNPIKQQSILIKGSRGMQLERVLDLIF